MILKSLIFYCYFIDYSTFFHSLSHRLVYDYLYLLFSVDCFLQTYLKLFSVEVNSSSKQSIKQSLSSIEFGIDLKSVVVEKQPVKMLCCCVVIFQWDCSLESYLSMMVSSSKLYSYETYNCHLEKERY